MKRMRVGPGSAKQESIHCLFLTAVIFSATLFFVETTAAQAAPSGYSLIGTIQSGGFSGAVISESKGEQSFYRLREKLPDGSQLFQVREDSISLKGPDGVLYDMYISHERTVASAAPPQTSAAPPVYIPPPQETVNVKSRRQRRSHRTSSEE